MTGVRNFKFFLVEFNTKVKATGAAGRTVFVSSRSMNIPEAMDSTDSGIVYGILREISGLGQSMGELVADDKYGTITLDVTRGSFEHDKRFYDLFEKETILHQDVTVYSCEMQPSEGVAFDLTNEWDQVVEFIGEVSSVSIDIGERTCSISVKSKNIPDESPIFQITREQFPDAPDSSLGIFVPIIFGKVEVPAYPVGDGRYVFQTHFNDAAPTRNFASLGIDEYYHEDQDGSWEVFSQAPMTPEDFQADQGSNESGTFADLDEEYAVDILSGYVITAIKTRWGKFIGGGADVAGKPIISAELRLRQADFGIPQDSVGRAQIAFKETTFQTSDHFFLAYLERPVFLSPRYSYSMSSNVVDEVLRDNGGSWRNFKALTETEEGAFLVDSISGNVSGKWNRQTISSLYWFLWGVRADTFVVNESLYQDVLFKQRIFGAMHEPFSGNVAEPLVDPEPPSLDEMSIVLAVAGIEEDGSSDKTGGGAITRADAIVRMLYYLSNGDSLDGLDYTTFDPASYAPQLAGVTEGRQTYREILLEILENSAMKLVPRRSAAGPLAIWAYGVRQESVAVISEADCTLNSIEIAGEDAIVNRVRVQYGPRSYSTGSEYLGAYEASDALSQSIYGVREVSEEFVRLRYIASKEAAERWANYKFAQYARERMRITFTVPFWKNNYREIDIMDVIEISHIDSPSFFGTAPPYQEPPITVDARISGDDYNLGDIWRRAQSYRLRVLGRHPNYSINEDEATIQFTCLVLDNPDEIV